MKNYEYHQIKSRLKPIDNFTVQKDRKAKPQTMKDVSCRQSKTIILSTKESFDLKQTQRVMTPLLCYVN